MLLAADIGNTNVTLGAFQGDQLLGFWRLATDERKTADEYGTSILSCLKHSDSLSTRGIDAFAFGSVVPTLSHVFEQVSRRYFDLKPFVVTPDTPLGIKYRVDHPGEVGADRILNSLAAYRLYGGPAVVIDFGTATTFDCISKKGEYLGGVIVLGPKMIARALSEYTAKLPQVEIKKTSRVVGKNTIECIQSGLFYGYLGMVEKLLHKTLEEVGRGSKLFATGGLADLFIPSMARKIKIVPDLTLQGLRIAHEISSNVSR
ncbi:MAG: type III pantothenate kinase [Elusimicrobia bacterium]|nr:type III pantothenate kinase [Elusimicrobiota bacterium]